MFLIPVIAFFSFNLFSYIVLHIQKCRGVFRDVPESVKQNLYLLSQCNLGVNVIVLSKYAAYCNW